MPRISPRRDQSPSFSAKWFIATEWDLSVSCVMSLKIRCDDYILVRGASEKTISSIAIFAFQSFVGAIGMTRWNSFTQLSSRRSEVQRSSRVWQHSRVETHHSRRRLFGFCLPFPIHSFEMKLIVIV